MPMPGDTVHRRGLGLMLGRRRILFTLGISACFGFVLGLMSYTATAIVMGRAMLVGFCALLAFGLFEQWPKNLPPWMGRWVLQLLGVVASVPFSAYLAYWITVGGNPDLANDKLRLAGYGMLVGAGVLFGPWIALAAMLKQREAFAHEQALAFQLERSELERQALDARMRLLQAQVQPHFLFNTLANVQALVDTGAPQASRVLGSLIEYLRAAVPRLDESASTLGRELQLVRAYLELMHMRMPDRLRFDIHVDAAMLDLRCPPTTLLTLVENAVKHGIDPSEIGGYIVIEAHVRDGRCRLSVRDDGAGLREATGGLGTGLASLRERLQLAFGGDARLDVRAVEPRGVLAEVEFPAQQSTP